MFLINPRSFRRSRLGINESVHFVTLLFLIIPPPGLVTHTIGHITDMAHHGIPELHSSLLFSFLTGLGSLNVNDSLRISSESTTRIYNIFLVAVGIFGLGELQEIDSSSPGSQMMSQEI